MTPLDNPLEVLAATMALPIVQTEIDKRKPHPDMGDNVVANEQRARLDGEREPWEKRKQQLLNIIKGPTIY
jgi:hypothetical protein